MAAIGGQLSRVRWWLVLAYGVGAAVASISLMYLIVSLYATGLSIYFGGDLSEEQTREFLRPVANFMATGGGLPALFLVLTTVAAGFLTRTSGVANGLQGLMLGLVAAVVNQLLGRVLGPFAVWELVVYPVLGLAGGWLGVVFSRGAVERQGGLYRATGELRAADTPADVAVAVGQNLARADEEGVTLWGIPSRAEEDGGVWLEPLGSWAPPGARPWPEGRRLDVERLPAIATLWDSFHSTPKGNRPAVWVGLENYQVMVADPVFWKALTNNLWFALATIPLSIGLALLMALWVNERIAGRAFLRLAYFTPTVLPMVAVANIWLFFYTPQYGLLEQIRGAFGLPAQKRQPAACRAPRWWRRACADPPRSGGSPPSSRRRADGR